MERRGDEVWRLWMFLAGFAFLLGCSRIVGHPSSMTAPSAPVLVVASPTVQPVQVAVPTDGWWVLDQVSKVVGIVGGASGIAALVVAWEQLRGLRQDQQRIADELARRPSFTASVVSVERDPKAPLRVSAVKEHIGKPFASHGMDVVLALTNSGSRTAHNVLASVTVPTPLLLRGGGESQMRAGPWTVMHPTMSERISLTVYVDPYAVTRPLTMTVICDDEPPATLQVDLGLEPKPRPLPLSSEERSREVARQFAHRTAE